MTKSMIENTAISASAGSGKTFQLAHRYVRLMACDVPTDRICALTFSRKAAGEIFDSIVKCLRKAASSDDDLRLTRELIGKPNADSAFFLRLLRFFTDNLHHARIGTLDSFIVGVIRAFPMELGIASNLDLFDSDSASAADAHREALGDIFNHRNASPADQSDFLDCFKQATFGREEKALESVLNSFVEKFRAWHSVLPGSDAWGCETAIWPKHSPWLKRVEDADDAADKLTRVVNSLPWPQKHGERWRLFAQAAREFNKDGVWSKDIEYLFDKLSETLPELRKGGAIIKLDRSEYTLGPDVCKPALALFSRVMNVEISRALEQTRGIYRVLDHYERRYDRIRRKGRMTFSDAQRLLTPANDFSGGAVLSRSPDAPGKLYIDYRLDCKLDHWLLDEFQDTSDLQWEVLSNLVAEVIQDDSGRRSFFYVGDVKQAIHGWRGGNARLFGEILRTYGSRIRQAALNTSFRSCQAVIDAVNQVFGKLPGDIPDGTANAWRQVWQEQHCEDAHVPAIGHVAILEPKYDGGKEKPGELDRFRVVSAILKEIDPVGRGLSTGILVRKNEAGEKVAEFLRSERMGMSVVHEGKTRINDNPVVSTLLALIQFAAHPGDTFAWRHLEMSPLNANFQELKLTRNSLSLHLLHEIQTAGFQPFIRNWGARLKDKRELDAFGTKRLNDLIAAAGEFDAAYACDCGSFLRFITAYAIKTPASDKAVRVMTVHQAKGLEFDLVILPELMGESIVAGGHIEFLTDRDSALGMPRWGIKAPRKCVEMNDPVLAEAVKKHEENACFDELCVLYVAMTRAKQGLYMITSFPGRTAEAINPGAFLKIQLAGDMKPDRGKPMKWAGEEATCLYESGQRTWYEQKARLAPEPALKPRDRPPLNYAGKQSLRARLTRVEPSLQARYVENASRLFSLENRDVLDFGSAIHKLFEKVEWLHDADREKIVAEWLKTSSDTPDVKRDVCAQFNAAFDSDEVRLVLTRPEDNIELWKEKRFEIILDGKLVTGVFDRVVVMRDSKGSPTGATIVDYKSDRISEESEFQDAVRRYSEQMRLYAQALSGILMLDISRIKATLLFTRAGTTRDVRNMG